MEMYTWFFIKNNFKYALFAMKSIRKDMIKSDSDIIYVKREKFILKSLRNNPYVVHLRYTFQDKNNLFFVMENWIGGDLERLIKKKLGLTEFEYNFYISEVIVALQAIHKENVIYRDLKPKNILIGSRGHIKLADFGFAKRLNDIQNERTYTICGTPGYASPEVLLGAGHSYKTDIWSLGIFICELIGGFLPFSDISPQKMNLKIINWSYSLPKNINTSMKDLLKQILVSDPHLRLELDEIKWHPVFRSISWESVRNQTVHPPHIPNEFISDEVIIIYLLKFFLKNIYLQNK